MKRAFIFPGQGAQSIGMQTELAREFEIVLATYADASQILGYDLWDLIQNGPADKLNQTEYTQPALFAAGIAVWRIWQSLGGPQPALMAGHSLGEYTALCAAGALEFEETVATVAERGRLMQAATPPGGGAMAAVLGLDDATVIDVCADAAQGEVVAAANFNAPGQVVLAGTQAAVSRAGEMAQAAGARKIITLAVSVPSHCALMRDAAEQLRSRLYSAAIQTPTIPVLHNVDARPRAQAEDIAQALLEQLYQPVRWTACIEQMLEHGIQTFAECGPGKVLAGLNKRIARRIPVTPLLDRAALESLLEEQV